MGIKLKRTLPPTLPKDSPLLQAINISDLLANRPVVQTCPSLQRPRAWGSNRSGNQEGDHGEIHLGHRDSQGGLDMMMTTTAFSGVISTLCQCYVMWSKEQVVGSIHGTSA